MACLKRRRNRWVVDFRDRDGKRHWESYCTREEAKTALGNRLRELQRGTYRPPATLPSLNELAASWLRSKGDRRVSTVAQWQVHLDLHILPALGHLRLDRITVADVERFRDERRAAGLSAQTVNKLLTTCAAVFKFAARHELTDRNPAAAAERCRRHADEVDIGSDTPGRREMAVSPEEVLAPEEVARLIQAAEPGFYRTFFLTAALTGARVGEITGLTWDDIDLDAARVQIRRSVSWAKLRGSKGVKARFYEPKTETSRRTVPVAAELVAALRRWQLACPPTKLNLVFPGDGGAPRHRSTITRRGLYPALRRARLRRVTLHSLRHSFASALIADGAPVTQVAHLLGHSSPTITLAVYSHWFKATKSEPTAELARRICASETGTGKSGSKMVAVGQGGGLAG